MWSVGKDMWNINNNNIYVMHQWLMEYKLSSEDVDI